MFDDLGVFAVITILGLGAAVVWMSAHYEAETFNRCRGANVSTFDALWVELRVEDCKKPKTADK
jgi:hypothetical protein